MNRSIVVSASKGFQPGVVAFLNSFEYYHKNSNIKVYLLGLGLDEDWLDKHVRYRDYVEIVTLGMDNNPGKPNIAWSTKIPRFKFASGLSGVVMMCDADMFFCRNMEMYFDIAETGIIVGGANGSTFYFGKDFAKRLGEPIDCFWPKTMGSVPTWMDVDKYGYIWRNIYESKTKSNAFCDFELVNIHIIQNIEINDRKPDKILILPAQQVTGLHEFQLKPDTRVFLKHDKLVTHDGLEVLMVHGKWWQEGWLSGILRNMDKYCNTQRGNAPKCLKGAKESWQLLKDEFEKWSTGIK